MLRPQANGGTGRGRALPKGAYEQAPYGSPNPVRADSPANGSRLVFVDGFEAPLQCSVHGRATVPRYRGIPRD